MKNWKKKIKKWHDNHCKVKHYRRNKVFKNKIIKQEKQNRPFVAPIVFSIIDNLEETVVFLSSIINEIKKQKFRQKFFIDCSNVEKVSIEALMYIIAIVYNIKTNARMKYSFSGNLPKNKLAQKVFIESGYLKFFKSKKIELMDKSDNIQIMSGKKNDPQTAKEICDFTKKILGDKFDTRFVYNVMIELMGNTFSHAYNENYLLSPEWFFYAEANNEEKSIEYTFIDVGEGIPSTINKKFFENHLKQDDELILSALDGENRSATKMPNRGLGLPYLLELCEKHRFDTFSVISGYGYCYFDNQSGKMKTVNNKNKVLGTVFKWKIIKEEV